MNRVDSATTETTASTLLTDVVSFSPEQRIRAEIGHILFLDLVGFSRLSMEEQDRVSRELRTLVRETPEFQRANSHAELIGSDTGDGMALTFFQDPLAPIQCAIEVTRAVTSQLPLQLRMGIHSGPVTRVPDINGNQTVSGAGINFAQRLMDCGDRGHILLSAISADMVRSFESYKRCIVDLGEVTVKHGMRIHVFNFVMNDVGNSVPPVSISRSQTDSLTAHKAGTALQAHSDSTELSSPVHALARPQVGVGKTVSLVYKRRGAPLDNRLGKLLESELEKCGFVVKIKRQEQFGPDWANEVEEQFLASDAVIFLLSAAACSNELFEYEVETAGKFHQAQQGRRPQLFALRVGYEERLIDTYFATLGQIDTPIWHSAKDDEVIVQYLIRVLTDPSPKATEQTKRERAGGAVPLRSAYYVVRPTDNEFSRAIARQDSIVLVKGGRQMGKTSLLARGLQEARESGSKVVLTDFQSLSALDLRSADDLYRSLAEKIAEDLDLDVSPDDVWNEKRSANMNLERYIRKEVFVKIGETTPLVWGLDEVDRLFTCDFGSEVFGLFRSWHNKRSLDPTGPWSRLTLAIAYATEAHLFITDMNQSPFNVGTRLALSDFTKENIIELNARYDSPMSPSEIDSFYNLVGGQPYLTRRGLDELTGNTTLTFTRFLEEAVRDEGDYGDHLRRMYLSLCQDPVLVDAMRSLLHGLPIKAADIFYRLRTAGLVLGDSPATVKIRCRVYKEYLEQHLF